MCLSVGYLQYKCPGMVAPVLTFAFAAIAVNMLVERLITKTKNRAVRMAKASAAVNNEMLTNLSVVREFAREDQELINFERQERLQGANTLINKILRRIQWPVTPFRSYFARFLTFFFFTRDAFSTQFYSVAPLKRP